MKHKLSGFALVELILVMGILLMLFGFISFNLIGQQRRTSVSAIADVLISDMSSQQTKAMLGAGLTNGVSYGIYFQQDNYTLFQGTTYSPSDISNFTVIPDTGITFTNITFPGSSVVFSALTGEVSGFLNGNNTITIEDSQGTDARNITINRYGVVAGEE